MGKVIVNLFGKIIVFLFGLSNIVPTQISIYDKFIVTPILNNVTLDNIWYNYILIIIIMFRLLIIYGTYKQAEDIYKYANRYCF